MLDVLVVDAVPVLSQAQAYDSAVLLDVLERHDRDASGLLRLVRHGQLQVKMLAAPGVDPVVGEDPYTLANAFARALTRGSYVFSGWPVLEDLDARRALLGVLTACREASGRLGDSALEARVDGLLALDRAVRESPASDYADPGPVEVLTQQVVAALRSYAALAARTGRAVA